ncbi:ExsB family transcriptional regulator [Streptomyces chiangmaiensis]
MAEFIGARVVEVTTHEGELPNYRANGPDRCFHCKNELFTRISAEVVAEYGLAAVAYGENADDLRRPDRPGQRAATEHRVLRPLAEAGLDKAAVRRLARALQLPCADKPAAPCLASRIPHFEEVTPEKLRQIEQAEQAVRRLGFTDCRVRHHGETARIELPVDELGRAVTEPVRSALLDAVRAAGFRTVTIDLAGIRSGAFALSVVAVTHG